MDDVRPAGNIPEFSVSEISGAVKRTLEGAFGRVRIRGEISGAKRHASGHIYLCLKDEGSVLEGVIWRSTVPRLGLAPENGVEVIATGRITTYGDKSKYQLVIDRLDYAGAGALLARVELLRVRLAAEGLFDAGRKRALPLLPAIVGVITSESGAVIQDIRTTILRRFPRPVLLWPVPVQGADAAARIAAAIAGFCRLPQHGVPRPDVLIVARGGGSLEDLMAFNEEIVVRAAADCAIPLISAVGHETDTTLIDHAASRRAPTPTAAAELAVPSRAALVADLAQSAARLLQAGGRTTEQARIRLERAARGLPDPVQSVGAARQRLDDRADRLRLALPALVAARRAALVTVERRLPGPLALIGSRRATLAVEAAHLRAGVRHMMAARAARVPRLSASPLQAQLREARARLDGAAGRLESVSHKAVLARGYAVVLDPRGGAITRAGLVRPGARLRLVFEDGDVAATAASEPRQAGLPI